MVLLPEPSHGPSFSVYIPLGTKPAEEERPHLTYFRIPPSCLAWLWHCSHTVSTWLLLFINICRMIRCKRTRSQYFCNICLPDLKGSQIANQMCHTSGGMIVSSSNNGWGGDGLRQQFRNQNHQPVRSVGSNLLRQIKISTLSNIGEIKSNIKLHLS